MAWMTAVRTALKHAGRVSWTGLKSSAAYFWGGVKQTWADLLGARTWVKTTVGVLVLGLLGAIVAVIGTQAGEAITGKGDAYQIDIQTNPDKISTPTGAVGGVYLIPVPIDKVPTPPSQVDTCAGRYDWAHRLGGIDAGSSTVEVTVSGRTTDVTRILSVEPVIVGDRGTPPTSGSVVRCAGRGGPPNVRYVNADLDGNPPTVTTSDGQGNPTGSEFDVTQGQSETFRVTSSSLHCDCKWKLVVHVMVNGKATDETYPKDGTFETTGFGGAKPYLWLNGAWKEDTGQAPPKPPDIPNIADACTLLGAAELSTAARTPLTQARRNIGIPAVSWGPGASGQTMLQSHCDYRPSGSEDAQASVQLNGFKTSDAARGEFDAETAAFASSGEKAKAVTVATADSTNRFREVLLVRKGRLVLVVQVRPDPPEATLIDLAQKALALTGP